MVPQDEPPQLTFQATPALLGSLLTTAANPVLVLVFSDVTGEFRKETEIGEVGGGPELVPLLQATTNKANTEANISLSERRNVTGVLHSVMSAKKCVHVCACEQETHDRYGL
jgi:hypothetical protein